MASRTNRGPATRAGRRTGLTREQMFAVGSILLAELCERVAFYGVTANLVLFCTTALNYSSDDASIVALVFEGTVYLFPMLGGFVADVWLGKFRTIVGSSMIYIYGLVMVLGAAWNRLKLDWYEEDIHVGLVTRKRYLFSGLLFIAVGAGGFKTNIGPFGAQQVADLGKDAVKSFFHWYYWFVNVGALIAFSGVAYVQQEIGFVYGFLIPFISIILALVIFVAAHSKYVHRYTARRGGILRPVIGVCVQSCSGCRCPTFNRARKDNGGRYDKEMVDGVKAVVQTLPVFGSIIVYWAVYGQMNTSLFLQSERMDISIGTTNFPATALMTFNNLIILVLIPIMDRGVYPLLAKIGRCPTHLQRIGIGIALAACAMLYAGVLEIIRKNDITKHGYIEQAVSSDKFNASKISMFAQAPEFICIGISEVFASITGLEFAYTQAPSFMQGLTMGLYWLIWGLGIYLSSLILAVVKLWRKDAASAPFHAFLEFLLPVLLTVFFPSHWLLSHITIVETMINVERGIHNHEKNASDWFPKEPNNGHMEYFLFLLAALAILNLIAFVMIARWYESKNSEVSGNEGQEPEVVSAVVYENRACERENPLEDAESTSL